MSDEIDAWPIWTLGPKTVYIGAKGQINIHADLQRTIDVWRAVILTRTCSCMCKNYLTLWRVEQSYHRV